MKTTDVNSVCGICHDVIETQHVFSENNQVYLKENNKNTSNIKTIDDEWFPINFYWISDVQVRTNLNNK